MLTPDAVEVAVVAATVPDVGIAVSADSPVTLNVAVGVEASPRSVHPDAGVMLAAEAMPATLNTRPVAVPLTAGMAIDFDDAFTEAADAATGLPVETPAYTALVQATDCEEDSVKVAVPAGVAVVAVLR